ncbi:hypothetical protein PoB_001352000 [Plakobranchus ocellatus]|uniref:Uncharacterized protein n=1 Tax=Plakobranchus ocellatus TaxID=259542 RepID=A0AAV3YVW2_9GAST|nr:hypothetical protein PoB_001352000 [Plakobranchus ocellatus]
MSGEILRLKVNDRYSRWYRLALTGHHWVSSRSNRLRGSKERKEVGRGGEGQAQRVDMHLTGFGQRLNNAPTAPTIVECCIGQTMPAARPDDIGLSVTAGRRLEGLVEPSSQSNWWEPLDTSAI